MTTVVDFRAKQATGNKYMPTDKLYANYFFIKIDFENWSLAKIGYDFRK